MREEQAKLDNHEDRVTDPISRLLDLGIEEGKAATPTVANHPKPFEKLVGFLTVNHIPPINGKMLSLDPAPDFDLCFLQHLAESIGELKSELVDVTRGLSLLESDDATLSEWSDTIRNALSDAKQVNAKRSGFNSSMTSARGSGVKLPKLEVPIFDGSTINELGSILGSLQSSNSL